MSRDIPLEDISKDQLIELVQAGWALDHMRLIAANTLHDCLMKHPKAVFAISDDIRGYAKFCDESSAAHHAECRRIATSNSDQTH